MRAGRAKIEYDDSYTMTRRKRYCDERDIVQEVRSLQAAKFTNILVTMSNEAAKNWHQSQVCKRDVASSHYHYKSWSSNFVCPKCGRTGRFNLNFLGSRNVVCDGVKFYKVAR